MAISEDKPANSVSPKRKKGIWYDLKNTSFGESRSYLFEYGLLLLLTGGLLYILMAMIRSFYSVVSFSLPFFYTQESDVLLLSALTVVLPLVIILIQRTSETELGNPSIKNLPWRKVFLGIFLGVVSIWAILSSILFINSILGYLSNGLLVSSDFDWKSSLTYLVSTVILTTTAWSLGNDYRYVSRDQFAGLRHFYRYALVSAALVVGLLFLFFPFRENRTMVLDAQISTDLYVISSLVDSYYTNNSRLPASLSDLSLASQESQRASIYNYTYELKSDTSYALCADFSTSSGEYETSSGNGGVPNVYSHTAGINCFDFNISNQDASSPAVEGTSVDTSQTEDMQVPAEQADDSQTIY